MDEHHSRFTKETGKRILTALVLGFLIPIVVIFFIVRAVMEIQEETQANKVSPVAEKAILERIKPVGEVTIVDANAPKVEKTGEQISQAVCAACHTSGALGAPKTGDKTDWKPRIAKGYNTLLNNAIKGIRAMPARGGNPDLSDTEVARAVVFLANQSGASFPMPKEKAAAPTAMKADAQAVASSASPSTVPAATAATPATPAAAASAVKADGKTIYDANCAACHGTGVAGAPKLGDKAAWTPRIKQGTATLYASALKGKGAMPAKGGNTSLSDADVKAAVDYMAAQSK